MSLLDQTLPAGSPVDPGPGDLLSTSLAAKLLGVDVATVRRWIADKRLAAIRQADRDKGRWTIPRSEVLRVLEARNQLAATFTNGMVFLSPQDAAELLGVHHATIRRWLHDGRLRAMRRGPSSYDRWLIPIEEVERVRRGGPLRPSRRDWN